MATPREKPAEDAVRRELREHEEEPAGSEVPDGVEDQQGDATPSDAEDDRADAMPGASEDEQAGSHAPGDDPAAVPEPQDAGSTSAADELVAARSERDEYLALAQRTQADFENWRKRAAREAAAAGQRVRSGLVGELLPVVDNLERALDSATEAEEHLAGGVRLVHSELAAVLSRNGVEPFDPAGERFDPAEHEALSTREEGGTGPGTVLDVVEKGYRLNGTVLRPARVVVSG